ncbi:MAG: toll/interleukin-1 receptor domain-containing protein [Azoarcus sp.]|jgi:hypothetical protein|nr:toll/interleukin-1 receptor domain-containing protein [Azoarcus sp.]
METNHHPQTPKVFISYSHADQKLLDELLSHLKPLEELDLLDCWSDKEIAPGKQWQQEIEQALSSARVAVLLVSRDFLASDFITKKELPILLKAADEGVLKILWLPISATNYKHTELADFQALHPPNRPLDMLRKWERQKALVEVSEKILEATNFVFDAGLSVHTVALASNPMKRPGVLDWLKKALLTEDATERYWVYITLGEIGGNEVEPLLKIGLSDKEEYARRGAEEAMENYSHKRLDNQTTAN